MITGQTPKMTTTNRNQREQVRNLLEALIFLEGPQLYTPSSSGVPCDRRLKKDIKLLPGGAMAKLARMQAVSFIYKNDPHNEETLGFIAQELQQIDPRLVTVRGGYLMRKW